MKRATSVALLIACLVSSPSTGQCVPEAWSSFPAGFNGTPRALAVYKDQLILAGTFTMVGGVVVQGIARWDGFAWQPLGSGMSLGSGGIAALAVYNGDLIAGGNFSTAGGAPASSIARWNGTLWQPLGAGIVGGFGVDSLTVHNGELVAGGLFSSAGGVTATNLARWNGTSWATFGSGLTSPVSLARALTVFNGELIVGGGSVAPYLGIARWDGAAWQALSTGMTGLPAVPNSGTVNALTVYNGELIATGFFTTSGGVVTNSIARWNGSAWMPGFGTGAASFQNPNGIATLESAHVHDGSLFVGGQVTSVNGTTVYGMARWNGSVWQPLGTGPGTGTNAGVSLASFHGSLIACGGLGGPPPSEPAYVRRWSAPFPYVDFSQAGPGAGVSVLDGWLVPGHEYFNVYSFDLCIGGPGTGPYGGLCFADLTNLFQQLSMPLNPPFHFVAPAVATLYGPVVVPAGLTFDAICADVTPGSICISTVTRYTTL